MSEEAKRIVAEETWERRGNSTLAWHGDDAERAIECHDVAQATIAACAPEALRLIMSLEANGQRCPWCGWYGKHEDREREEDLSECPASALAKKAGLR